MDQRSFFLNDAEYVIDMTEYMDASLDRYVVIAICCDVSEDVRDCHLEIIPGTPANAPEIPFPVNTPDKTYLTLAAVRVAAFSDIPAKFINDYRSDEKRCGWCKCILGKCRVTELLAAMDQVISNMSDYLKIVQEVSVSVDSIKRRLGMMEYVYPDITNSGEVGSDVAASLREFAAEVASGKYSEYKTEQEKWKAYASEHDLNGEIFPDVNNDGEIGADDAAIVDAYAAAAGAGDYADNVEGFRAFMLDRDNAIFGAGISGFRVMTQAQYDRLANPKADIQYNIIPEVADEAE